ncbi:hypothetical protein [Desulfogranum mediterraneum]|uniref:hypothetical protein n=1 Tax=Desulfogranum mediterraneum TaxID=160661 RepID=UPI0012948052|nr:hypothetical protein [Desulfogranum mediterraneum]
MNMLISALFCIAYGLYYQGQRTYPGFLLWLAATFAAGWAHFFLLSRGVLPTWLSIGATNGFFVLSALLRVDATSRFLCYRKLPPLLYLLPLAVVLACLYFYLALDQIAIRNFITVSLLFLAMLVIASLFVLHSPRTNRLLYYSAALFMLFWAAVIFFRAVCWLFFPEMELFGGVIWQVVPAVATILGDAGFGVLFLLMNNQRAEQELSQANLAKEALILELQEALNSLSTLEGIIPICSHCKSVRDDQGAWKQLEAYVASHADVQFSHGICEQCAEKLYQHESWYEEFRREQQAVRPETVGQG